MITPISAPPISPISPVTSPISTNPTEQGGSQTEGSFGQLLGDVVSGANEQQIKADASVQGLLRGENVDIHQVMLSMEQARLSMLTVVEIRNKMVEAYQEISRMQM